MAVAVVVTVAAVVVVVFFAVAADVDSEEGTAAGFRSYSVLADSVDAAAVIVDTGTVYIAVVVVA